MSRPASVRVWKNIGNFFKNLFDWFIFAEVFSLFIFIRPLFNLISIKIHDYNIHSPRELFFKIIFSEIMSDVLYSLSVHGEFIIASIPLYFLLLLEVAKSFKNGDKIAFRSLVVFTIAYAIYALGASYADIVSQSYQDYLIRQDSFGSIIVLNVLLVFVSFLKGNETSR